MVQVLQHTLKEEISFAINGVNHYIYGEDTIATNTADAIEYFKDLKNQPTKLVLQGRLDKAKKLNRMDNLDLNKKVSPKSKPKEKSKFGEGTQAKLF